MNKSIKRLLDGLKSHGKNFDEELAQRFFFLPITVIIAAILVLGVNFVKGHFAAPFEETEEMTLTEASEENKTDKSLTHEKVLKMSEHDKKLDINEASKNDFQRLPGIGSTKAEAIVDAREKMGKFFTVGDIKCAEGIGAKLFEKIRSFITVNEN